MEPKLNAIIRLVADEAMGDAKAAEAEIARGGARGPLHGIPVGLKDIIDLAGHPTTCHSKLQLDRVADRGRGRHRPAAGGRRPLPGQALDP